MAYNSLNPMTYRIILFDFDGTLADSAQCSILATQAAFTAQHLPVPDAAAIVHSMGIPIETAFRSLGAAALDNAAYAALLADFRRHDRAVLLATSSFWEGVDVRGDRLVCVVIDKLPFAAPNDPVTRARHRLLTDKGLSPFIHDTLPQAIITLKQGVGRLIRDTGDYGVLVLADPRLTQKNYGQTFLNSLPPMSKTRKIEVIDRFFAYHENPTKP